MSRSRLRAFLAIFVVVVLLASACGDDSGGDDSAENGDAGTTAAPEADEEMAEPEMLDVMVTDAGIEGVPAELAAGAVTVAVAAEADSLDLDFTQVTEGTTEDEFRAGLLPVLDGGPFPDFIEGTAGAVLGDSALVLEPGNYFVWTLGGASAVADGPPTAEDLLLTELTVNDEGSPAELPENPNSIVATDYAFDVDVQPGDGFNYSNAGAEQFHHAVLFNFGTNDPAAVEEGLIPFLSSEDGTPPPGLDIDFANFEAGGTAVFSPGGEGQGVASFEAGTTYAVVCFIQDLGGGPPHAFAEDMFEVFTVGDA